MRAEEAATEEKRQSGLPLLGLRAPRWIFELGTLVRGERHERAPLMARGPPRTNARHINIAVADHVGYPSTSFVHSLMYLETHQIQRGSGARRGGARCIYCECCQCVARFTYRSCAELTLIVLNLAHDAAQWTLFAGCNLRSYSQSPRV